MELKDVGPFQTVKQQRASCEEKETGISHFTLFRIWVSINLTTLSLLNDHHDTLSSAPANLHDHKDALAEPIPG